MVPEDFITEAKDWDVEMRVFREHDDENVHGKNTIYAVGKIRNKFAPYLTYDFSALVNENLTFKKFINVWCEYPEINNRQREVFKLKYENKVIENVIEKIINNNRLRLITNGFKL